MPRPPRLLLSQSYYHIITRGNNRNVIFKQEEDYCYFLKLISKYKEQLPFDLYHYCLMSNHVHFLMRTQDAENFSVFMKKINLAYFHYFKRKYGWDGHLWQSRFKSQPVGKDEYFIQCGKYIELNPVRANITKAPEEYLFSSYGYYALGKEDGLIANDFMYETLGKNKKECQIEYEKLIVDEEIEVSQNKIVWGSADQRYREKQKMDRKIKKLKEVN